MNSVRDLEMSKNRNQKVLITDEAINKVPLIKYRGIPENEYATIQELAKEVLVISKNENDSNEVALTYSMEHESLIAEGREYIGISLEDVQFFLRNVTVKMMVVITNLGSISYLVKGENIDQRKAVEIYNNAVSMHNEGNGIRDYQKAVAYFLSHCHEANIVYEDR